MAGPAVLATPFWERFVSLGKSARRRDFSRGSLANSFCYYGGVSFNTGNLRMAGFICTRRRSLRGKPQLLGDSHDNDTEHEVFQANTENAGRCRSRFTGGPIDSQHGLPGPASANLLRFAD